MDVSLDELVSQLKEEIFEEPAADDDNGEKTDDQDEIDIESGLSISKSDFNPIVLHTSKNNLDDQISLKHKWIPTKDPTKSEKSQKSESKNKKLPVIVLKKDNKGVINNAIMPDQLHNVILKMTKAKPTTAPTKPKLNAGKQLTKIVPIQVRVIKENEPTSVNDTNKLSELELEVKLLKELLADALSKIPTETKQGEKITENSDVTTKNTADFPEKPPKIIEKQPIVKTKPPKVIEKQTKETEKREKITETHPNITENLKIKLLKDFFDIPLSRKPTSSTLKRKITESSDEKSENSADISKKQPKLIETDKEQHLKVQGKLLKVKGLKITKTQQILTRNPRELTDILKVKVLEDILSPQQKNTDKRIEISRNTDSERQPKISETQAKITENCLEITDNQNAIVNFKPPHTTGTVMADRNIDKLPIIKLKAKNLTKIDYNQLQSMTEIKINKFITNAATKIGETRAKIEPQSSNDTVQQSHVTKKPQIPLKLRPIIFKGLIQSRSGNTINPNSRSTVNTPSVNTIWPIKPMKKIFLRKTNRNASVPVPIFNDNNSIQLNEKIKPEVNPYQITLAEDTFENEILGHTEIVNEEQNINIENALKSTAEVTIKDEVHTKNDLETADVQTNGDSVQVIDIADPLFIEHKSNNLCNIEKKVQRTEHVEVFKSKPNTLKNKAVSPNTSPKCCKICKRTFFSDDSFNKHKHKYLKCKCRKEFRTQKALEEHKLKEHYSIVQTKSEAKPHSKSKQQKNKSCSKCTKVLGTNFLSKLPQTCSFKMLRKTVLHSIKYHLIKRGIKNQNLERVRKQNHAERSDEVKTEGISEVNEIDAQEESTFNQEIGNTRIEKRNEKITASKRSSTLIEPIEGTRKKQNPAVLTKNNIDSQYNLESLDLHINTAQWPRAQKSLHKVFPTNKHSKKISRTWHLLQKTALFECENCNSNFSEYPEKHYELCKQNMALERYTQCKDCNKEISYNYNKKTQEFNVNHKFQHLLDYKLKTIPINSKELKIVSECPICRFHFFHSKPRLLKHVKVCKGKRCAKHECCGFVFNKNHYNKHLINHTAEHILLIYDLLIKRRIEELKSEDAGSLITIDDLKKLQTTDSKIIYAYGDKYRVVSRNEYMSLQAGWYQCRACKYKSASKIEFETQHEKKHGLSRRKAGHNLNLTTTNVTASSLIAPLTCKLCPFVAGRKVELKYHQIFTCPARKIKATPTLKQTVSVRETLKSLSPSIE